MVHRADNDEISIGNSIYMCFIDRRNNLQFIQISIFITYIFQVANLRSWSIGGPQLPNYHFIK